MASSSSRRADAVIFDLGNVLIDWDPYLAVREIVSEKEWHQLVDAGIFQRVNALADQGAALEVVLGSALSISPRVLEVMSFYYLNFERSIRACHSSTRMLLDDLADSGVRMLGLTNWARFTFEYTDLVAPYLAHLEAIVVSGYVGYTKPDRAIFEHIIGTHELLPDRTVFIDDMQQNVDAARAIGLQSVQFTDAAELRRIFVAQGLL